MAEEVYRRTHPVQVRGDDPHPPRGGDGHPTTLPAGSSAEGSPAIERSAEAVEHVGNGAEGFAAMVLQDILGVGYSLHFASFVVSLLALDPLRRPSPETIKGYFKKSPHSEEITLDFSSSLFMNVLDL